MHTLKARLQELSASKVSASSSELCENGSMKTTFPSGTVMWTKGGKLHRLDGPAKENIEDGEKHWYIEGRLHRLDGPAVTWPTNDGFWWIDGCQLSKEDYDKLIQEIEDMPLVLRLIDPRWWVREYKESL